MKQQYAQVEVTSYARLERRVFDYLVPPEISLSVGSLVEVPFGKSPSLGVVIQLSNTSSVPASRLKPITRQILDVPLPSHLLTLSDWLKQYYASSSHNVWSSLLPSGLRAKPRVPKLVEIPKTKLEPAKDLTQDQTKAEATIWSAKQPVLLEGITGSGKTHIYEALIRRTFAAGQSVLFLSPEIFLTNQLRERLEKSFANQITTTHSQLTAAARRNIWLEALHRKEPWLYLGPRSALFLPIHKLGLIIVDEAHDTSYKQEQAPRYNTRDVAAELAKLTESKLVFGTATPDLFMHWLVDQKRITRVSLTERFGQAQLPSVQLIDMHGLQGPFSPELMTALKARLARGEQSLLLHNRRGTARKLSCDDCGSFVRCPHCDVALVFHADTGRLHCHICGRTSFPPATCPTCHSRELHFRGFGTKFLETELRRLLPSARIGRIDRDERSSKRMSEKLSGAQDGSLDILIGTQMIAKGLDLANITLVGIVAADDLSTGSDFQSRERAVSLMMQAAGRAGRAQKPGEVLIQTRQLDNPIFRDIQTHDWRQFATEELDRRRQFHYPPFRYLARITVRRSSLDSAEAAATSWMEQASNLRGVELLGPSLPFVSKQGEHHLVQVIAKSTRRTHLLALAPTLPADSTLDIDPISVI